MAKTFQELVRNRVIDSVGALRRANPKDDVVLLTDSIKIQFVVLIEDEPHTITLSL